jgi:Zn-dependent peptidase ImmA (M78 family)
MGSDRNLNSRKAVLAASKIIEQYGITKPKDIHLKDIAFALGVRIVEGPLAGAAASLVRRGDQAIIRINDNESNPHRKRFSIGHELGHFVLQHGHTLQRICSTADLNTWYNNSEEAQANTFAAELLLPGKLIAPLCDVDASDISFDLIREISTDFRVSLTATAIRFVEFCPEPCAIVCSMQNKISWSWTNGEWQPFIERNVILDQETVAYDLHKGKELPDEPIEVPAYAWVDEEFTTPIMEHSVRFPRLGFVLSLLWMEDF